MKLKHNFSSTSGKSTTKIENEFIELSDIGALVGEDCMIGSHVVIDSGVIVGRKCKIESMKRIRKNIDSNSKVM